MNRGGQGRRTTHRAGQPDAPPRSNSAGACSIRPGRRARRLTLQFASSGPALERKGRESSRPSGAHKHHLPRLKAMHETRCVESPSGIAAGKSRRPGRPGKPADSIARHALPPPGPSTDRPIEITQRRLTSTSADTEHHAELHDETGPHARGDPAVARHPLRRLHRRAGEPTSAARTSGCARERTSRGRDTAHWHGLRLTHAEI